jgi:hypothetical protein
MFTKVLTLTVMVAQVVTQATISSRRQLPIGF